MVYFEDGSRIWLTDIKGVELPEYDEQSGTETRTTTTSEWRNVYVKAEIGKAFEVHYQLKASEENKRKLEVFMDGAEADDVDVVSDAAGAVQGWTTCAEKITRFSFGKLRLVGEEKEAEKHNPKVHDNPSDYLITAVFYDAVVDGTSDVAMPTYREPALASAVPADSAVAREIGCQIRPGWVLKYKSPEKNNEPSTKHYLEHKQGATEYAARFVYRTEKWLVDNGIIEDPNPPKSVEELPEKSKVKRKRKTGDAADGAAVAGEGAKKSTPRAKRIKAEAKPEKRPKEKENGVAAKRKQSKDDEDEDWVEDSKKKPKRKSPAKAKASSKTDAGKQRAGKAAVKRENKQAVEDKPADDKPFENDPDAYQDLFDGDEPLSSVTSVHA